MTSTARSARKRPPERNADWQQDRRLFVHYRRTGDQVTREAIVSRYLPLVRMIAGRYRHTTEPFDDLVQVGALGLLKAIDRFDVDRGHAFSSFAVPTISGEIKRHFRDRTWSIKVPRGAQEIIQQMAAAERGLEAALGRSPTPAQVAAALRVSVEDVLDARMAGRARTTTSLDALPSEDEPEGRRRLEVYKVEEAGFAAAEDAATLERLLQHLDPRKREILRLYFEEDLTQAVIADHIGLSQMHVSRLIREAIAQLAAIHNTQAPPDAGLPAGTAPSSADAA